MTRLREIRLSKGLTQKQVSEQTGLSLRTLQHYEQGGKNFDHARLGTILNVCLALDCSLFEILESDEYKNKLIRVNNK